MDVAMPSGFPEFLMALVERTARSLSPESIRPVYQLLSAVGSAYLDLLSLDVIAQMQSRLVEVLTKLDIDDHFGDLLCLGVLAKFASRPCNAPVLNMKNEPCFPKVADRYVSARKIFEAKRASKTLDLAVIRAITASSESCTLSLTDILESLRLSSDIVNAVDCREKEAWLAKNGGKVKKLHKKIFRPGIDPGVQCAVYNGFNCSPIRCLTITRR